ncbi:hypothetical protein LZ31DRAFT_554484 [Colletotrichum somersetense]|nr:hypothetical protein LZ31DRAFT_554484 [Colletotrichum somersetense]
MLQGDVVVARGAVHVGGCLAVCLALLYVCMGVCLSLSGSLRRELTQSRVYE